MLSVRAMMPMMSIQEPNAVVTRWRETFALALIVLGRIGVQLGAGRTVGRLAVQFSLDTRFEWLP